MSNQERPEPLRYFINRTGNPIRKSPTKRQRAVVLILVKLTALGWDDRSNKFQKRNYPIS